MGFKAGSWFNPLAHQVLLSAYTGKYVGVDFSILWHQISQGVIPGSKLWVARFIKYLRVFALFEITPVIVFDSGSRIRWKIVSESRSEDRAEKRKRKQSSENKFDELVQKKQKFAEWQQTGVKCASSTEFEHLSTAELDQQLLSEATKLNAIVKSIIEKTPEDIEIAKTICALFDVQYFVAPLEADYVLASLYRNGDVAAVLTSDFDTPTHGIMKMLRATYGEILSCAAAGKDAAIKEYDFDKILAHEHFECSVVDLRDMSFAVTNDYTIGMPGVGVAKMISTIKTHGSAMDAWRFFMNTFHWNHICEVIGVPKTIMESDAWTTESALALLMEEVVPTSEPKDFVVDDASTDEDLEDFQVCNNQKCAVVGEVEHREALKQIMKTLFEQSNYTDAPEDEVTSYKMHIVAAMHQTLSLMAQNKANASRTKPSKPLKMKGFTMDWIHFHVQYHNGQQAFRTDSDHLYRVDVTRKMQSPDKTVLRPFLVSHGLGLSDLEARESESQKCYIDLSRFVKNKVEIRPASPDSAPGVVAQELQAPADCITQTQSPIPTSLPSDITDNATRAEGGTTAAAADILSDNVLTHANEFASQSAPQDLL